MRSTLFFLRCGGAAAAISVSLAAIAYTGVRPFSGSGVFCQASTAVDSCVLLEADGASTAVELNPATATAVGLWTERGYGIDMDYIPAGRMIVSVSGRPSAALDPAAFNPYDAFSVLTTKRLAGDGLRQIVRNPATGALSLSAAEAAQADYVKKDTVVLVGPEARTNALSVDASSGLAGQSAGDVVVVADRINTLTVKANGYDGKPGESPLAAAAKKAVDPAYAGFETLIPAGLKAAFQSRRAASPSLPLDMTQDDLDNFEASGLACRSDETAVIGTNPDNSYALSQAGASGASVPEGINLLAYGREEAKRTLCRRPAEVSAVQSCAAEPEYSWQIACGINQEQRSFATFKRQPIQWQRLLCGASSTSQIRRKIIRQANVTINIPGGKSYTGLITRAVSFDDAAQVYIPNLRSAFFTDASEAGRKWTDNCSKPDYTNRADCESNQGVWSSNGLLSWYNPFWMQDVAGQGSIEVTAGLSVANTSTGSGYPAADALNSSRNTGAALTFIPRAASETDPTLLFPTRVAPETYGNAYGAATRAYTVSQSCANIIDLSAFAAHYGLSGVYTDDNNNVSKTAAMAAPGASRGGPSLGTLSGKPWLGNPKRYPTLEYLLAFDSRDVGFTLDDLASAAGAGSSGFIQVTNCQSFEVMDGVVTGDVSRGEWALISGAPDVADIPTAPPSTPTCPASKPTPVGSETFVQYEDDGICYANNPLDPPEWLKEKVRRDNSLSPSLVLRSSDVPIDALSSRAYVADDVFADAGFPLGSVPTTAELNREFIWPSDMTESQILAVAPAQRDGYCVEPNPSLSFNQTTGMPDRLIDSSQSHRYRITRARVIQKFDIPANSSTGVAIPTGALKKTCDGGIRLDVFLTQVSRPTCRAGASTKQKIAWWSDRSSANTWSTWTQKNNQNAVLSPSFVGDRYALKTETTDTRYDELPSTILTSMTHDVDPSEFISAAQSSTGRSFPQSYGFTNADGSRFYPGWTRSSSLINGATVLSPDSFVPFAGTTTEARKAAWCNAPAFTMRNGHFVKSFGARGILRDAAKHVYGFNVTKTVDGSPQSQRYVAIEVTGSDEQYGFYMTQDAFSEAVPAKFNASVETLSSTAAATPSSLSGLFKKKSYPNIGGRFTEACGLGESYNQFTGFCHRTSEDDANLQGSWRSTYRTVERYDQDGARTPWAVRWSVTDQFLAAIKTLNSPFRSLAVPAPSTGLSISTNTGHLARVGLLRPVADMASDDAGVERSVTINRPETLSVPVLGPFFAESVTNTAGGVCGRRMRLLAVPVPTTPALVNGASVSVPLDTADEFLPAASAFGSMFIAVDFECPASGSYGESTGIFMRGAVIERRAASVGNTSGISNLGISAGSNFTTFTRAAGGSVSLSFFPPVGTTAAVVLSDIKESMVSGVSATTGFETLAASAIRLQQRDRAGEWLGAGRHVGGRGWQSSIKTAPTVPVSDGAITALSCSRENLRGGVWSPSPSEGTSIVNGSPKNADGITVTNDCASRPDLCALTEEELSLYTRVVPDSLTPITTRPAVEQYTPWSFELPTNAPRTGDSSSSAFGRWTKVTADGAGAPTPSCDVFASSSGTDDVMPRASLDEIPSTLKTMDAAAGRITIQKPGTVGQVFMSLNLDNDIRRSDTCVEWDKVTGRTCLSFRPSVGRADLPPYVFGGAWTRITVESSPRRVSQDCALFKRHPATGEPTEICEDGLRPLIASQAICSSAVATAALCQPCQDNPSVLCAPWMLPKEVPQVSLCKPGLGGCPYETQSTIQQVETSVPMPGRAGESGTDGGSVTIFCGDCGNITVENRGGLGGLGSATVASSVSQNLTCLSWNHNPLDPRFFSRVLWSKPFDSAGNGQNGVRGQDGGARGVYSNLTPEALYMIGRPEFWLNGPP